MDNKSFIDIYARRISVSKKEAANFAAELCDLISETLCNGDVAVIPGFGSFETKKKMERVMSIPSNQGKKVLIPPKIVASFKQSALLKQRLNESGKSKSERHE